MKKLNWMFTQRNIKYECKHEWTIVNECTKNGNHCIIKQCVHCGKFITILNE